MPVVPDKPDECEIEARIRRVLGLTSRELAVMREMVRRKTRQVKFAETCQMIRDAERGAQ